MKGIFFSQLQVVKGCSVIADVLVGIPQIGVNIGLTGQVVQFFPDAQCALVILSAT